MKIAPGKDSDKTQASHIIPGKKAVYFTSEPHTRVKASTSQKEFLKLTKQYGNT